MSSRQHIYIVNKLGDKITDTIASFVGSGYCVVLHTAWFALWFIFHLDINLLTNIVSLEAIFLCIVLLMSQNRQAAKDHLRDDHEAEVVDSMPVILKRLLELSEAVHALNLQQYEILTLLKEQQPKRRKVQA